MNKAIISTIRNRNIRYYCYYPIKRPNLSKDQQKKTAPPKSESVKTSASLANQLRAKIFATGPITVADYMKEVLINPTGGYYMSRDVIGTDGDFITSPEIGQIFGELIAIWCLSEWQKIGSPNPFQIIELGPGRGTLSRDILRVLSNFKMQSTTFSMHLVEISEFFSKIQAQKLCYRHNEIDQSSGETYYRKGETASGVNVFWYRRLDDVPKEFSILLAHEFFDAMPIHKLQFDDGLWKEILIDIDTNNPNEFRYVLSKFQTPISKIFRPIDVEKRNCFEYSIETNGIIEILANRFVEYGGFGLIIDYGHFGDKTDTFRAFKKHKLHDPLIEPGTADITADVDFRQIKYTAEKNGKLITFGPIEQKDFLKRMQGETRLKVLLDNCLPENRERIISGYEMLTSSEQMGKRFKFFSMFPSVLKNHLEKFPVSGFSD